MHQVSTELGMATNPINPTKASKAMGWLVEHEEINPVASANPKPQGAKVGQSSKLHNRATPLPSSKKHQANGFRQV
jgi:hypothetical protein